jgi:signal peptidase I
MEGACSVLTGDLTSGTGSRPAGPPPYAAPQRNPARRVAVIVLVTALTVALIRSLLVQSFVVPTGSMSPTVRAGERVLVSRLSYRIGEIRRGDVIVFDGSGVFEPEPAPARTALAGAGRKIAAAFSLPIGSQDYVKRVFGLPGERVACCDQQNRITVNGVPLDEPYVDPTDAASILRFDIVVPAGRLFVLGDHRSDSADSRAHLGDPGGGTVPMNRVVGRVVGIYWPLSHAGGVGRASPKESTGAASGPHSPIGRTTGERVP